MRLDEASIVVAPDGLKFLAAPLRFGAHVVPGAWRRLLPADVVAMQPPAEQRASCQACPMVALEGFRPDYRCCTYQPLVPNFLLGLALEDERARRYIERAIALGLVTPEGMQPSPAQRLAADEQTQRGGYGKGEDALCHFLEKETGHCTIHAFRNSVCATFFCVHEHGSRGVDFWESLEFLVGQSETAAAQWSLATIGFDPVAYFHRLDDYAAAPLSACDDATRAWSAKAQRHLWGDWYGREVDLLRACAQAVEAAGDGLQATVAAWRIIEPERYERALAELLARRQGADLTAEAKAAPRDFGPQEHAPMAAYIDQVRESYRALRAVPREGTFLVLSPQAEILANPLQDAGDRHYRSCPAKLSFAARPHNESGWQLHLSRQEAAALAFFSVPRRIEPALWQEAALGQLADAPDFIARWLGHDVLNEVSSEHV